MPSRSRGLCRGRAGEAAPRAGEGHPPLPLERSREKGVSGLSKARGRGPAARRVGVTEAFKQGNSSSSAAPSCVLCKLGWRQESCLGLERPLVGRSPRDAVYLNQGCPTGPCAPCRSSSPFSGAKIAVTSVALQSQSHDFLFVSVALDSASWESSTLTAALHLPGLLQSELSRSVSEGRSVIVTTV